VNDLCLVEAVDRFGESIVVAVAMAILARLERIEKKLNIAAPPATGFASTAR
jgi:hypothetical protein